MEIGGDVKNNASRVESFIELGNTENELIQSMVEYWGDVGEPPEWRQKLAIGNLYRDEK